MFGKKYCSSEAHQANTEMMQATPLQLCKISPEPNGGMCCVSGQWEWHCHPLRAWLTKAFSMVKVYLAAIAAWRGILRQNREPACVLLYGGSMQPSSWLHAFLTGLWKYRLWYIQVRICSRVWPLLHARHLSPGCGTCNFWVQKGTVTLFWSLVWKLGHFGGKKKHQEKQL